MTKKFAHWLALAAGLYVLQSALLPYISYHGVGADLLLLMTLSFSFLRGGQMGAFTGFLLGLMQDLATGTFFGINTFCKMVLGYLCGKFANNVFRDQPFLPILVALAGTTANYCLFVVIMLLMGYRFYLIRDLQYVLLPMLCYHVLLAYPVYYIVSLTNERTQDKKGRNA